MRDSPVPAAAGPPTLPENLAGPRRVLRPGAPPPADLGPPPWWVRAGATWEEACVLRVDHAADLPLAVAKAARVGGEIVAQPASAGVCLVAPGFKCGVDFVVAGMVETWHLEGLYRVPMGHAAPAAIPGGMLADATDLARAAGRALPPGRGGVLLEIVVTGAGARVAHALAMPVPPADMAWVLREAFGIDLEDAAAQAAAGRRPWLSPSRGRAAATAWLASRSGVVRVVRGADAARAVPGVRGVEIFARPGDTLGHVRDLDGRARTARVRAVANTPRQARAALDSATAAIHFDMDPVRA